MTSKSRPPPRTVEQVDIERYLGTWYDIAHLPFRPQAGCYATTATYRALDGGRIEVVNRCRDGSFDGRLREAKGRAWPVDETNARLKVRFFWPFTGSYWILELDEGYEHAMVGVPSRRYLWILSRAPSMPPEVFASYVTKAAEQGFAVERLVLTPHEGVELDRYPLDEVTADLM